MVAQHRTYPGDEPEDVPVPTKQRPGDQRLPVASDAPSSHAEVMVDLQGRLVVGIERYGKPLQAHNGRNSFQDAYEEVLDQAVYMKTLQIERADFAENLKAMLDSTEIASLHDSTVTFLNGLLAWLEA